ncbi:MAG: hypothetical protein JJU28_04880 [Cyclobacteriaceae bacterium]|nr:hypothetical protein [Cyclobacteriaceae bacterium]
MEKFKNRTMMISLIIGLVMMGFGCGEEDSFNISKIDFEILTMHNDIEKVIFESGTDIVFALKIYNNSGSDFEWHNDYSCMVLNQENFLLIKMKIITEDDNIIVNPVGLPYKPTINCPTINLPSKVIAPGESVILIGVPWSNNPENAYLLPGTYFTEFTIVLPINEKSESWDLRADFIVY